MGKQREIDLYKSLRAAQKAGSLRGRGLLVRAIPLAALALVLGAVWYMFGEANRAKETALAATLAQATGAEAAQGAAYSDLLDTYNALLLRDVQAAQGLTSAMASYPVVNSAVLRKVTACGGAGVSIELVSYEASSGLLRFNAVSQAVLDIPDYIRKLSATGLFEAVDYTGYDYADQDGVYAIQVACYLAETAGKGAGQ